MEEELKCYFCRNFYDNPILLPCSHTACLNCALKNQQQEQQQQQQQQQTTNSTVSDFESDSASNDSDKMSVLSETDSGVVLVKSADVQTTVTSYSIYCPSCSKTVYLNDRVLNLPRLTALQNIVDRFLESRLLWKQCQLCDGNGPVKNQSKTYCEQCEIFYCEQCRESCHPLRGPLAQHSLVSAQQGQLILKDKKNLSVVSSFQNRATEEEELTQLCKTQKAELSQSLQQLSEKAKSASEIIQRMKQNSEIINESFAEIESSIRSTFSRLVALLQQKEESLIDYARGRRDILLQGLRDEAATCTSRLQQTTATVQFSIEALKETDPSAFLQIGSILLRRISHLESEWREEIVEKSRSPCPALKLTLDDNAVRRAVNQMNFPQLKPPLAPLISPTECTAENNSITVAWKPHSTYAVDGYILELDDGCGGPFREVYRGQQTICTVDGLHFNCLYNARVRAYNACGEGTFGSAIALHTAEVAWFTFDEQLSSSEARLRDNGSTASTDSFEPQVLLGSAGFSKGVHYWEFTIEKFEGTADPAFGIARKDCSRKMMLGKDDKGWSMYIDHRRSWFLHNSIHFNRVERGIDCGSVVGVLIDFTERILSFFVDDEHQGTVSIPEMNGVYYPAVSINRNVSVTLHTALHPPTL